MSYTIKNLREVEDSAQKYGYGEMQESRFPAGDLQAERTGLAYHRVKPGRRQPFSHRHEEAEEVYVVIAGSGRIKLDDEVVDVRPLDAIRVAPSVQRAFEAGGDGLDVLAFGPRHKGDGEIFQDDGFWDGT